MGDRLLDSSATLADLLAASDANTLALIGTEPFCSISYRQLNENIETLAASLAANSDPQDRIAIVLPNGPEFLIAFLAITRAALIAAPFNRAAVAEFPPLWRDAGIKAVIGLKEDLQSSRAALDSGAAFWPISVESDRRVKVDTGHGANHCQLTPQPEDIALFLYTSGTTSKPKGVPLTHRNLMRSVGNIAGAYRLTPDDHTMLVMPLFHVHGLIGATLSTLYSGGSVIAPPRFSAGAFWPDVAKYRATWYSAVPTIHRTLLLRADDDAPKLSGFRFIRSCSSALAPAMLHQMENRFQAPVLEAYGMTEAAHQIATNPLPPAPHKPGSVGLGFGVEIAALDEHGRPTGFDAPGEIAIKGPNVMRGYDQNPEANAAAFANGFLRTGDRGVIDNDGYVSLIGRIKELINRGGEKISPLEIDAVLLSHPAVAEAACFSVADEKYGEEVSAAVVLKADATQDQLRAFCREHIADFKAPKSVHVVAELPKTATGKVQRSALSRTFQTK